MVQDRTTFTMADQ